MAIWYPGAGSWVKHLQQESYISDIRGQLRSSSSAIGDQISEQTKQIVADNEQLMSCFGRGFDSLTDSLTWGLQNIESRLWEINASIDSLRSDFNYNIGILIHEAQINNRLLTSLLDRIDSIQKTLDSPILTKARELYYLGCEQSSKGLYDKAIESLHKSEDIYDADCCTQYQLGYLYLFGINNDCNVIDLEKARYHLTMAARYAKAEMRSDRAFAKLAAESLLLASIAIYGTLGDAKTGENPDSGIQLLGEAKDSASRSLELDPNLSEARYHIAKYCALMRQADECGRHLSAAIRTDPKYSVKVDVDHAFDAVRPTVINVLSKLREEKKTEADKKLSRASTLLNEISPWMDAPESRHHPKYVKCEEELGNAVLQQRTGTYFGYLAAISSAETCENSTVEVRKLRFDELKFRIEFGIAGVREEIDSVRKSYPSQVDSTRIKQSISSIRSELEYVADEISQGLSSLDHYHRLSRWLDSF